VGFSDGDLRDDSNEFQHVGPETANARGPYVTIVYIVMQQYDK